MPAQENPINRWQQLKNIWAQAQAEGATLAVNLRILYEPDAPQQPAGLEVRYTIDNQSFTRTFRGIPEGYDAVSQSK